MLVVMPVSDTHRSWWGSPATMAEFRSSVRGVAARHSAPFLDGYDSLAREIPQEYFWDPSHLNLDGATVLTRRLARDRLAPLLAER